MVDSHSSVLIFFAGFALGQLVSTISIGALLQRDAEHLTSSGGTEPHSPPEPDPSRSPRNVEPSP